jgi:histidyl-tRNA synthetase
MERIASLLKLSTEQGIPFPKVFIAVLGDAAGKQGLIIADRLRLKGLWTEIGYAGNSLKSQLRRADRVSAQYVFIIGDDEIRNGKLLWKRLSDSSQGELRFDEIEAFLSLTPGV